MESTNEFIFLLDGNFPDLAYFEMKNMLEIIFSSNIVKFKVLRNDLVSLSIIDNYIDAIGKLQQFSRFITLTKSIFYLLCRSEIKKEASFMDISKNISESLLKTKLTIKFLKNEKLKVEVIKKYDTFTNFEFSSNDRNLLKISVAETLVEKYGLEIDLDNPTYEIRLILTNTTILVSLLLIVPNRWVIRSRAPSKRSYFHPASMKPFLIRTMINFAMTVSSNPIRIQKAKVALRLLDPFMGGAGMLIEGSEQGYSTIGVEIGYWECRGARMNLANIEEREKIKLNWTIIKCNSVKLPFKAESIDLIVTDPPYGQSTIIGAYSLVELLSDVLSECHRVLKIGSRMVISVPEGINVELGSFRLINQIRDRVHRSLTRLIYILQKI